MSITAVSYFPVKFKHIEGEEGLSRAHLLRHFQVLLEPKLRMTSSDAFSLCLCFSRYTAVTTSFHTMARGISRTGHFIRGAYMYMMGNLCLQSFCSIQIFYLIFYVRREHSPVYGQ